MRLALFAAALLLAQPALALLPTDLFLDVRDASDRPARGAFVMARELGELGKFHGTVTYCIRAAARPVSTGVTRLPLPGATIEALMLRDHRMEVLAYRPGHCVARAKGVEAAVLRLRPAPNRPEERLPYLEELATTLVCRRGAWGPGSTAVVEEMIAAIEKEVKPLVKGPWERRMAHNIRTHLKIARSFPPLEDLGGPAELAEPKPPSPRDFIVVPATWSSMYDGPKGMWVAAPPRPREQVIVLSPPSGNRPGQAVAVQGGASTGVTGGGGGGSPADRAPPTVRCRFGEPSKCDMDQRDEAGKTALGEAVRYLKVDEVKVLVEAGADPAVAVEPGGLRPTELAQERMKRPGASAWDVEAARQILAMLAASPKARSVASAVQPEPCEPLNILSPLRLR